MLNARSPTWRAPIVDVCRATLAESTHFNSVEIAELGSFRDAGVLKIDTALETYHEIKESSYRNRSSVQCILHIGCDSGTARGRDSRRILEHKAMKHGFLYDMVCRSDSANQMHQDWRLVDVRDESETFLKHHRDQLKGWAAKLVTYRRNRAQTAKWELYASIKLACPLCKESLPRSQLIQHMGTAHHTNVSQQ